MFLMKLFLFTVSLCVSCFVYISELSSSMTIVENLEKHRKELKETKSPEILPFGGHALASHSARREDGSGVGAGERGSGDFLAHCQRCGQGQELMFVWFWRSEV